MDTAHSESGVCHNAMFATRRRLIGQLIAACTLSAMSSAAMAQVPPPPPPGAGHRSVGRSGFLPTSADIMRALRQRVDFDTDEALELERLLTNTLADQSRLLRSYGINPDYERPDVRLSRQDARELNDEMDAIMDQAEDDAGKFLPRTQMSALRDLLRRESSARRNAINAMRR
ncbi:MAG: hypothetical protein AAF270_16410 [Pseudomonadota bacterium]